MTGNSKQILNMMKNYRNLVILLWITQFSISLYASEDKDWMLDGSAYKAKVTNRERDLVIGNGLIERVFRDGATIGLNNLVSGEGLLRSVRPEAELIIDGIKLPVGGLIGQPIHSYFLDEWLQKMTPDTMALEYVGYEEGAIEKRFDWKARTEWMASNPAWPPKGKMIKMRYKTTDALVDRIANRYSSDESRPIYFNEEFSVLSNEWTVFVSGSNNKNSFNNEGKPAEMLIPANTSTYAERALNPNTEVITARISPGTDNSSTWGPGVAWVFDNKTIKFYIRPSDNKFGVTGAGLEYEATFDGVIKGESVYLKMQRSGNVLFCSYSYDNKIWNPIYQINLPKNAISKSVRVGKMDKRATNTEPKKNKGEIGRSRIEMVKATGPLPASSPAREQFNYLKDIEVTVNYEVYDGIPLMSKWVTLKNNSTKEIVINTYKSEILAVNEPENEVTNTNRSMMTPNITVESDFAHNAKHDYVNPDNHNRRQRHIHWNSDKQYKTQINWLLKIPCLLEAYPQYGPEQDIRQGKIFNTHRIWELFHDTWDRERKSLQVRKMYRTVAPWIAENPIFMHARSADDKSMQKAIDQCADVGFEMVIMTFGSGVSIENPADENLNRMKALADYAHLKNIEIGGYSLLASRSAGPKDDVIMPHGQKATFGNSPCVCSEWGQKYMANIQKYFETTGQGIFEHDGSYPGDECASTLHPGHKGLADSQWNQFQKINAFYRWCKSRGIFLNIPDVYFMNGQNKTGMGYRETNWSLPREQQEVIERQNIYDGTWNKTSSMGWMMVPLVEYHGGGAAATIEPLKDHLPHYEMRLANNFGAGVMACYRGPQLYDTPETRDVVKKWVNIYKSHRALFDSDVIHLRRPDGRDWDGLLHVNPSLEEKGLLMVYNPLPEAIVRTVEIPVYYTGLDNQISVTNKGVGKPIKYNVSRDYKIKIDIEIPAKGYNYYIFK